NTALRNTLKLYLGFTPAEAAAWLAADPDSKEFSVPPSGDFHDELTYLESIRPVPEGTIVEADGLTDAQGPMWQVTPPAIELGRTIHDRPPEKGMGCANALTPPYLVLGKYMCQYMAKGWTTGQEDLMSAEGAIQTSTSLSGWQPATLIQTQTLLKRS